MQFKSITIESGIELGEEICKIKRVKILANDQSELCFATAMLIINGVRRDVYQKKSRLIRAPHAEYYIIVK